LFLRASISINCIEAYEFLLTISLVCERT
jgi:hypothetical protein